MALRHVLCISLSLALGSCASEPAAPAADETPAAAPAPAAGSTPAPARDGGRLIAPVRGEAVLDITKPNTRVVGNEIETTITVRNPSTTGAIAGFRVDENWYNKGGDPVGGDTYRHPAPLRPGDVVTITLRTPRNPAMNSNQYQFTHANGTIKTNVVEAIEAPAAAPATTQTPG